MISGSQPQSTQRQESRSKQRTRRRRWSASYPRSLLEPRRSSCARCRERRCASQGPPGVSAGQPGVVQGRRMRVCLASEIKNITSQKNLRLCRDLSEGALGARLSNRFANPNILRKHFRCLPFFLLPALFFASSPLKSFLPKQALSRSSVRVVRLRVSTKRVLTPCVLTPAPLTFGMEPARRFAPWA